MTVEIERKWIVTDVPGAGVLGSGAALRQGYLAREDRVEARIRITDQAGVLTIKAGRGLTRTEVEVEIGRAEAEALWAHTEGRRIEKTRHRVEVDGGVAEVDLYAGDLHGLCTVEVEFDAVEAADAFVPPDWFGREVTGEKAWSNAELSEHGVPHD